MNRSDEEVKPKKNPYNRPRLEIYGDLREVTQTVSDNPGSMVDNPNQNHSKTH